ncbi:hypothetical protein ACHAWX_005954 [Stephanocyclus meneghinianus]
MASIAQPELVQSNHILCSQSGSGSSEIKDHTKNISSGGGPNNSTYRSAASKQAMLSISPIRYDRPAKPTPVYPTQQLAMPKDDAKDAVFHKDMISPPVIDERSILSPLAYNSAHIRNLSNQFIVEETPPEYAFENPLFRTALTPNSRLYAVDDETTINDGFEKTPDTNYYDTFPIDLSKSIGGLCADVESAPINHEHIALDTNLDVNSYNTDSKFPIRTNHSDMNAMDESTLDDFSLSSNGSFDLEAFSSAEIEDVVPTDPKGIYAMKSMKMKSNVKHKTKKSKGIKSSKTKSKALSTEGLEPTDLDILRGRGGLTNRHPGNMKFRDEARKLRSEYRHCDTSRQEKFALSQRLVKIVKEYGGRFLEKGDDKLWHEMSIKAARKKASQVLREEKWD